MKSLMRFVALGAGLAALGVLGALRAAPDPAPSASPSPSNPPPRETAATAPRALPRIEVAVELPPDERIRQMKEAMRLESPEARVATVAAHVEFSRSEAEREIGLQLIASAGPPAAAWEAMRRLFRSAPLEIAAVAAERMGAMNPALTISEMTDALTSPLESARQIIAVHRLRDVAIVAPPGRRPAATALAYPGLDNDDAEVRREALLALTEIATPMVADRIRDYASEETDPELRAMAEGAAAAGELR